MNQKIQELIDNGTIRLIDVLAYANDYMLEQSYQYEMDRYVEPDPEPEYEMTQEEMEYEQRRLLDERFEEQLMMDEQRPMFPEYIIASTSYKLEETMLFEADADGRILNYCDYGSIRKITVGENHWQNKELAIASSFPYNVNYYLIRDLDTKDDMVNQSLYKRFDSESQTTSHINSH